MRNISARELKDFDREIAPDCVEWADSDRIHNRWFDTAVENLGPAKLRMSAIRWRAVDAQR